MAKKHCELKGETYNKKTCAELTIYPVDAFTPFKYFGDHIDRSFNRTHTDTEQLKSSVGSYAAHFWNNYSRRLKLTIHDKTLMNVLAEKHCPDIYFSSEDFNS